MTIPASALMFRESGLQVAVVGPGNHAMLKRVSVATDLGTKIVIASGLTATDRVIDNPPDSLANGDSVRLASTSATTALTQHNEAERSHVLEYTIFGGEQRDLLVVACNRACDQIEFERTDLQGRVGLCRLHLLAA